MTRRLIIRTTCPLCGKQVEAIPDGVLKQQPGTNDAEMIVTRSGCKQYIHSSCWYSMITEQKRAKKGEWIETEEKTDAS